jgi:hypothetical protein
MAGRPVAGTGARRPALARPGSPPRAPRGGDGDRAARGSRASWDRRAPSGGRDGPRRSGRRSPGSGPPWSRCWSARRKAGGIVRVRAETSRRRPSASCRITTRLASHARRRDVSAGTRAPSSRTDCPG